MINLIGCNKENFSKLLELMQYKPAKNKENKENKDEFFIYTPKYFNTKNKKSIKSINKDNPFKKLSEIRFR